MTNRFRKLLSTLCVLVLVFTCAAAFADEPQADGQDVVITDIDVPEELFGAEKPQRM